MEHVKWTNEFVTDLFFDIVEEFVRQREQLNDNLIDPYLHCLVAQMYAKASEAIHALRTCRARKIINSVSHSSPIPRTLPCEVSEFVRLCHFTKWELLAARNLLAEATSDELARRSVFLDSRNEFPAISDLLTYLMVFMPVVLVTNLTNWKPTTEISQRILQNAGRFARDRNFLFNELFPNRRVLNPKNPVEV